MSQTKNITVGPTSPTLVNASPLAEIQSPMEFWLFVKVATKAQDNISTPLQCDPKISQSNFSGHIDNHGRRKSEENFFCDTKKMAAIDELDFEPEDDEMQVCFIYMLFISKIMYYYFTGRGGGKAFSIPQGKVWRCKDKGSENVTVEIFYLSVLPNCGKISFNLLILLLCRVVGTMQQWTLRNVTMVGLSFSFSPFDFLFIFAFLWLRSFKVEEASSSLLMVAAPGPSSLSRVGYSSYAVFTRR